MRGIIGDLLCQAMFAGPNALNGSMHALTVFDDGSGPALYAGGRFTSAGGVQASHIAKWDGSDWSPVGTGLAGSVHSLAVFDDGTGPALYAGETNAPHLRRWDGARWVPISGLGGVGFFWEICVYSMATFDDGSGPALFFGGTFDAPFPGYNIAKWDGSSMSSLPFVVGFGEDGVHTLKVFDDGNGPALFIGRSALYQLEDAQILRWDGSTVPPPSVPVDGRGVYAMEVFDGGSGPALYAGGSFSKVGGTPLDHIARWDGSSWTDVGGGMNDSVTALTVFDDGSGPVLFASGLFTLA